MSNDQTDEAARLGELLTEIAQLEQSRTALLERVESARSGLLDAGKRTAAIRATADLLCEHVSYVVTQGEEFSMLEREIREVERGLEHAGADASALVFEAESLQETLSEADEELERLSAVLVEHKGKQSRGH